VQLERFKGPGFGPIDLDVAPGEILAVTGFADAGHLRLVDAVYGADQSTGGELRLDGTAYRPSTPAHAIAVGIHQVPADRNAAGLAPVLSARENLFPNPTQRSLRPIRRGDERRDAHALMDAFDIRPRETEAQVSVLSGGNAQKLLVARALRDDPRLLLLSEPTAGVDIGARGLIYAKLRAACDGGLAVLMASSDFEEVVEVAHRVAVLCRGSLVTVLDGDAISLAAVTGASYGH
jgi:ribose transport system ATP-binding protein